METKNPILPITHTRPTQAYGKLEKPIRVSNPMNLEHGIAFLRLGLLALGQNVTSFQCRAATVFQAQDELLARS